MSNPTTPFGWQMPTNTDLVTDLPADFEVFGQAVATSMQDLLGGTTGQVLAKASNTDMDFVWSADAAGMTNPMTTTGDVIYSSPGSTPVRLGIGSAGNVLTVASGVPSWAAPAAGGMTLLSTTTLSGATVTVSSISQSYKNLYIELLNPTWATGVAQPRFRIDSSIVFGGGGVKNGVATSLGDINVQCWGAASSNTTGLGVFNITIYNYASTTAQKVFISTGYEPGIDNGAFFGGSIVSTAAISQVQIINNQLYAYNGGTLKIYGVN
jgi:hypothetical protein